MYSVTGNDDNGVWSSVDVIDLLHRSFGTLPVADVEAVAPPGVVAGVLSHVVERVQSGEGGDLAPGADASTLSVGAIFDAAADQGIGLRVIRDGVPGDVAIGADAADRLGAALGSGWVAIIPERQVAIGGEERTGWWLIDPATGRTLDELDDGRGAVLPERAMVQLRILWASARPWICLGITLYDYYHFIHSLLELDPNGALLGGIGGGLVHRALCH
jgi:hypothetical protein